MRLIPFFAFFSFLILILSCSPSSYTKYSESIQVEGEYLLAPAKLIFPKKLGSFNRTKILSFDTERENISATYTSSNDHLSLFEIHVYETTATDDLRFFNEYINKLGSIKTKNGANFKYETGHLIEENSGYRSVGLVIDVLDATNTRVFRSILFQCGTYFLNIDIVPSSSGYTDIANIQEIAMTSFSPILIGKENPLNTNYNIYLTPSAFQDSLTLFTVTGMALSKGGWAHQEVDSLERIFGFPDLYLDLQVHFLNKTTDHWKEGLKKYNTATTNDQKHKFFEDITNVVKAGFGREYLMDEYKRVLIVTDTTDFKFDKYYEWKRSNRAPKLISPRYFVITYDK